MIQEKLHHNTPVHAVSSGPPKARLWSVGVEGNFQVKVVSEPERIDGFLTRSCVQLTVISCVVVYEATLASLVLFRCYRTVPLRRKFLFRLNFSYNSSHDYTVLKGRAESLWVQTFWNATTKAVDSTGNRQTSASNSFLIFVFDFYFKASIFATIKYKRMVQNKNFHLTR